MSLATGVAFMISRSVPALAGAFSIRARRTGGAATAAEFPPLVRPSERGSFLRINFKGRCAAPCPLTGDGGAGRQRFRSRLSGRGSLASARYFLPCLIPNVYEHIRAWTAVIIARSETGCASEHASDLGPYV